MWTPPRRRHVQEALALTGPLNPQQLDQCQENKEDNIPASKLTNQLTPLVSGYLTTL